MNGENSTDTATSELNGRGWRPERHDLDNLRVPKRSQLLVDDHTHYL
jgi:hypothetical protein